MQSEASTLSSVSKSAIRSYTAGIEKSQAEASHFASSDDLYEKYFFSLIAEANRSKKVHPIFRLIEYFFIFVQLFLSSYNDFIPYENIQSNYKTFLKFFYIGFIGPADDVVPFIIALSVIDIATIIFFGICILDFQVNHEYRKLFLYILRIWHGHLYGILLIPNFLMLMKGMAYLGLHNNALGYIVVILTTVCGFISIWHYLTILPFFSQTPYLTPSPVHVWNVKQVYKYLLISAIPMGLESFLNNQFEDWIEIIPLFLMIGIFIFLIYELCSLPFKGILFNALLFGCFNAIILGAAFSIAEAISEGVSELVFYLGPPILLVVSTIVIYFVIHYYRKNVVKLLSYKTFNEPGLKPTEEVKLEHLETLNIKNKKKATLFIQIGFEEMCDMFVDWSLCKYIFERFPAVDDLVVFMSWLVSLFPSEIQFLHKLITDGSKIVGISVDNRFLFFQIHRIHIFRQSSTSRETSNDFNKVKRITDQTISAFCKYWINLTKPNNEFKTSVYTGLAQQKQIAEAAWSEALDKYPNNPRFANEHAIFLLEVECLFKESIKQNQNAQRLENGFRIQNDKIFRYFVLTYPNYLKSGTVDARGNLKGPQIDKIKSNPSMNSNSMMSSSHRSTKNTSSSSIVNTDTSNNSSSDQIDMQEGARFLPQMNLRLALQRAVNEMKAPIVSQIVISALLRAVFTIAFIIIVILISKPIFDSRKHLFNNFYMIDKIQHTYSLLSVQMPWYMHRAIFENSSVPYKYFLNQVSSLWDSSKDDHNDTEPKYMKIFNQYESLIDLQKPKGQIICELALQLLNEMNEFNNNFYQIDHSTDSRLEDLNTIYYQLQFGTYSCYKSPIGILPSLVENSISLDYLIRTLALQMRYMTMDTDRQVYFWGVNSIDFCEMFMNQNYISQELKLLSVTLSKTLYNIYKDEIGSLYGSAKSNKKILISKAKNKMKERIIQNSLSVLSTKSLLSENSSKINEIKKFLDDPEIDSIIAEEIEKDYQMLELTKRIKKNRKISLYENQKNDDTKIIKMLNEQTRLNANDTNSSKEEVDDDDEADNDEDFVIKEEEKVVEVKDDNIDGICDFIIAFSPFLLCFFIVPSVIFLSDGLDYEMKTYSYVLQHVPKEDCLKAGERIKPVEYHEAQTGSNKKNKRKKQQHLTADASNSKKINFWIFDVVSAIVIVVFLIIFSIISRTTKNKIEDCLQYYSLFIGQRNIIYKINKDIFYSLCFAQATRYATDSKLGLTVVTDARKLFAVSMIDFVNLNLITQAINTGDEKSDVSSSIIADKKINKIRFDPICSESMKSNIVIDYYKCTSLERIISYYVEVIYSYVVSYLQTLVPVSLSYSAAPYLGHMLDTRIGIGFIQIADRFKEIFNEGINTFNTLLIVIPIISVIFTLVTFIIEMILLASVSNQFQIFKSLMLRINPISFVSNNQLISLVYGKNNKLSSQIVSASHAVFTTSPDAMIFLNNEGVIEFLNPAATTIFGYTPEQMLGQHVRMILDTETKETSQLFYQMQLMQSGQSSLFYECDLQGKRDDDSIIYLKIALIGFASSDSKTANNFGLTCVDMTNSIKQKSAVEEAKKQSEQLLLQILPKDIIMRLNRGDTDISFTVQSSTIAFIDIEKFSNYSASLSASEIMQNLGLVFTAYDQLLAKYSLIIKIKLIGDDYMLAAGLFNPDVEPSKHATQVISFTLECLDAIEDLNEQLNSLLQVRIGVNSGGPLIAGVLGTDKPLFDIIGDPINVASRLQSTDLPGEVQISRQTYQYVADNSEFHIEERGLVELKGKGKQMTYFVHPHPRNHNKEHSENSQSSLSLHEGEEELK